MSWSDADYPGSLSFLVDAPGPVLRWPISSRTVSRDGSGEYGAVGRVQAAEGSDIGGGRPAR